MRRLLYAHLYSNNLLRPQHCAIGMGGAGREGARNGQFGAVDDPGDVH
jgi:hypothetical protein